MPKKITFVNPTDLTLDIDNPRFGELYTGSHKEGDLIEYLLFNESAASLVDRLSVTKEFYVDKPLLVLEDGKKLIVKDGNRRCAAVKALEDPKKYGLTTLPHKFTQLPAVIYKSKLEIENRIIEEHTNSMFREWDRMAKAIEVYRQYQSGSSIQSMEEIDSKPSDLVKLASFYYEAVKISGDDLKKLLRKGRGNTGGKTTIFERLFKYASLCGYRFKKKPEYIIEITDKKRFTAYIKSVVAYLTKNPLTTYREVDDKDEIFFKAIGLPTTPASGSTPPAGNPPASPPRTPKGSTPPPATATPKHKNKAQLKPQYNRTIPGPLKKIIDECYDLNEQTFTNSKIAMSRVVFECCLKYIIEETKHNNILLKDKPYFSSAFQPGKWTNFTTLKSLFQDLVKNKGKKQAFKQFDLETPHQIIHNYNIAGLIRDARTLGDNLLPLVEFMLDTEANLLGSLDNSKL
ncbi:MAG TPA: hypothetical protein VJA82_10775 [Sediminibacterium sp.]|uniref:hypothetical protein n=1 Tax=Sediminibacterium sp. TaxID=1917865 RepID=UPI0008C56690|nr:hypothetical protein [Sediminibacterium sp.]OHC84162.1 MAG: hypothetical protein A2472_14760 [Sphingobacteriia bacterium RIFOXYC2_FULL_35_18]OHC88019.1 MAG: hypothetical protein A2546_14150 [Sphingobacteriia bacterium RIFOXYD2_FULL_35_12]HLD53781.1 hypothetical protein [Sediminibacterium sp.]